MLISTAQDLVKKLIFSVFRFFNNLKMIDYRVSAFMGSPSEMKELIRKLCAEVNIGIQSGGTLVGGINICYLEDLVIVSQAITYNTAITSSLLD